MRKFEKVSYEQFVTDCQSNYIYMTDEQYKNIYDNIKMPVRKTKYSAGYDFHNPFPFTITGKSFDINNSILIPTGIKVQMNEDEYLALHIRSSLGFKYSINLANDVGIIDFDYYGNNSNEGHIMIKLVNNGIHNISIQQNEAVAQGIFCKYYLTNDDEATDERTGGIGSTN